MVEVDFMKDSPENVSRLSSNLKYMGIELAPGTHVDQVMRAAVGEYKDRFPQGVFKYRCMMYMMKPFFWALLPFKLVGLLNTDWQQCDKIILRGPLSLLGQVTTVKNFLIPSPI